MYESGLIEIRLVTDNHTVSIDAMIWNEANIPKPLLLNTTIYTLPYGSNSGLRKSWKM